MGAVCPKEVYPPADALQFCTTAYAGGYDSRATLDFIKETAKEPVRIGFAAMAIPLSRGEIDYAEEHAKTMGMTPVDKEVHPAADRRLHAVRHQAQGRQCELGVLLGAVGDAGEDPRGAAPAGLARRLHHLGAHRGRGRAGADEGPQVLRHRRELAVPGQPADPQGDHGRRQGGQYEVSGRAADRRLGGWPGARGRAQRRGLAGRRRQDPRGAWRA